MKDPKLKAAAAEIEAVCKKHGCTAIYSLCSPTHAEFGSFFPDWSLVQIRGTSEWGIGLHLNSEPERTRATVHAVLATRDMAHAHFQTFNQLGKIIQQQIDVDHIPFGGPGKFSSSEKPNI